MHKCGKRGCQNQIEDHYRFCFEHKDTPYKDICKIHGKQTFINYQCQKCKELKKVSTEYIKEIENITLIKVKNQ